MEPLTVLLRLVHIVAGAVWVGMAVFVGFFLGPTMQEVGPDGGKVMLALQRRGLMTLLPVLALGTLLSGLWLYWRASLGFQPAYLASPTGVTFALGGLAALLGYGLGIGVMRPATLRAAALARGLEGSAGGADHQATLAEIGRLRGRAGRAGRAVAALLLLATAAMAVARYL